LRAIGDLIASDIKRGGEIAALDQLAEFRRPSDVRALADIDEGNVRRERERLEAGEPQPPLESRHLARRDAGNALGNRVDMLRRRAAAAPDNIDEAGIGEFADQRRHIFRALVVEAEFVRQARIGISANQRIRDARNFGEMRAHLARTERAIQADRERFGMTQRMPERFRRLAGQSAAGKIGDRTGNHQRQARAGCLEHFFHREHRRLGVQRVEDRLEQKNVGATLNQAAHRFGVSEAEIVEANGAKPGIAHIG
jgi:hypothetical protein